MNGHLECAKILAGEEEERNALQFTDLITAAVCGDAEGVQQHISQAGQKDANGWTALMWSACMGKLEHVKVLAPLEKGMKNKYGKTAMMCAARYGHLECVKILAPLEKGMKDSHGWTALMIAANWGRLKCVKFLASDEAGLRDNSGQTAMMKLVKNGEVASVLSPFEASIASYDG